MLSTLLYFFLFCAKDGENSPPSVPNKDWEHSERGDSLAFFLEKDWRGFSFIFQYKAWKKWGGFSSAPSKGCRRLFYNGGVGRTLLRSFQRTSGVRGHAPILPSFSEKQQDFLLPSSQRKTVASYREGIPFKLGGASSHLSAEPCPDKVGGLSLAPAT